MDNQLNINPTIQNEVAGFYTFKVYDKDGNIKQQAVADIHPNLITNAGLDALGQNDQTFMRYCSVGSSSTTPAFTDTQLGNRISTTGTLVGGTFSSGGAPDYYSQMTRVWRFGTGAAAGNISEVGTGKSSDGTNLFSRALLLDGQGSPTTLTILSDEILDVTYTFRFYPKLTDTTGQVTFTGNVGGTYDWTLRPATVDRIWNSSSGYDQYGWSMIWDPWNYGAGYYVINMRYVPYQLLYFVDNIDSVGFPDVLGRVTTETGISRSKQVQIVFDTYVPGSYELNGTYSFGLTDINNTTGKFDYIYIPKVGIGSYQIKFSPAIPKTASDVFSFSMNFKWARRP